MNDGMFQRAYREPGGDDGGNGGRRETMWFFGGTPRAIIGILLTIVLVSCGTGYFIGKNGG